MSAAEIPLGMMRVWDPEQKKVILVPVPAGHVDKITLTLRIHDAAEKKDAKKSAAWATISVAREDLKMAKGDFIQKYVVPALDDLKLLKLS